MLSVATNPHIPSIIFINSINLLIKGLYLTNNFNPKLFSKRSYSMGEKGSKKDKEKAKKQKQEKVEKKKIKKEKKTAE
jgi:hypothetical protein